MWPIDPYKCYSLLKIFSCQMRNSQTIPKRHWATFQKKNCVIRKSWELETKYLVTQVCLWFIVQIKKYEWALNDPLHHPPTLHPIPQLCLPFFFGNLKLAVEAIISRKRAKHKMSALYCLQIQLHLQHMVENPVVCKLIIYTRWSCGVVPRWIVTLYGYIFFLFFTKNPDCCQNFLSSLIG